MDRTLPLVTVCYLAGRWPYVVEDMSTWFRWYCSSHEELIIPLKPMNNSLICLMGVCLARLLA